MIYRSVAVEAESSVCGGFPVKVSGLLCPAEPDVGIPQPYFDDIQIFTLKGKPAGFLEKKMTSLDWDAVEVALHEKLNNEEFEV